ncbi:sulfotransferase family protein [Nitriliruptor alkaliphilus]|uniref:sulfotransferase family protein n=1 Tax=Nitriliruptor alkaliphilus TaxID=427918 RepID=UPI0006964D38|nr:sulfotransferase [Nitriliruptor alkaliphilus]
MGLVRQRSAGTLGTHPGFGHVRVVDVTLVPARHARRLARRIATERAGTENVGPALLVLATPRSGPRYRREGLTVETVADRRDRDRALARYGQDRTVRIVPLGPRDRVAVAPVQVTGTTENAEERPAIGPLFVGGTGRSGTWALGRLLGEHPDLVTIHTELRFHAQGRAFGRLLEGSLPPDRYAHEFLDRYYGLTAGDGTPKGLQLLASRWEVTQALTAFRRAAAEDLPSAMRALVHRLVDPYARGRRAAGWVETTPGNAAVADALTAVLPRAHVVHIVRDGRDVAASIASMPWGPSEPVAALDRWAAGLRAADAAFRRADPARVHVVRFEDLVVRDRDATLTNLLDRIGIEDRTHIRARFDAKLDPGRSNLGRWRRDAGADAQATIDARYRAILDELGDEGLACLPDPSVS